MGHNWEGAVDHSQVHGESASVEVEVVDHVTCSGEGGDSLHSCVDFSVLVAVLLKLHPLHHSLDQGHPSQWLLPVLLSSHHFAHVPENRSHVRRTGFFCDLPNFLAKIPALQKQNFYLPLDSCLHHLSALILVEEVEPDF